MTIKVYQLAALVLWSGAAFVSAQSTRSVPDFTWFRSDVERILAEELRHGEAYAILRDLCQTAPKRLSGSKGMVEAVKWGERTMKRLGFENVHTEPCMVPHWERGKVARLTIFEPESLRGETLTVTASPTTMMMRERRSP